MRDNREFLERPDGIEAPLGVCEFFTVYFGGAHLADIRQGVIACLRRYSKSFGEYLTFSTDFTRGRWIPYTSGRVDQIAELINASRPDEAWQFRLHGGITPESASYYKIQALGFSDWEAAKGNYLSYLKVQVMPTGDQGDLEELVSMFQLFCDRVQAYQGIGGLGFALPDDLNGRRQLETWIYQAAQEVPLLEVEDPVFDQAELVKGLRGGNWLTAVGEPWLSQLGGIESLRQQLGEPFTVTPYTTGAIIRAGERYGVLDDELRAKQPEELTEQERGEVAIPPHYRRLARVLRPVRLTEFPAMHSGQFGEPCFDEAATAAWLKRFD